MTDTIFDTWPFLAGFPTTSVTPTTTRTMPERLSDVVNVRDFGALGASADYTTQLQAAFDAAFKTGGVDHGSTNSHLNRAVYIPGGIYHISAPLTLSSIYGGKIFGAGAECTKLLFSGGTPPMNILSIDGFVDSTIEDMTISGATTRRTDGVNCIELDGPADGLHSSMIINCFFGSCDNGIRIGNSGNDGKGITLFQCTLQGCSNGVVVIGEANSNVTQIGGGAAECTYGAWVQSGSFAFFGMSNAGAGAGAYPGQTDVLHDSSGITTISGGRSEAAYHVIANGGKVNVTGILHQSGTPKYTIQGTNNAEVSLTSCYINSVGTANTNGEITGDVNVALRNVFFAREGVDPIFASGFIGGTGKVTAYTRANSFTMATLPPNPAEGLTISVSDADVSPGWGNTISGTSTAHALLRYNSTNWTLVGK